MAFTWNGKEMYKPMFWIKEKRKIKEANIFACDSLFFEETTNKMLAYPSTRQTSG